MASVTRQKAEAVLSAVKEKFAPYIDERFGYAPELAGSEDGNWSVSWETGPFEWTLAPLSEETLDEEMTSLVQEFKPGSVVCRPAVTVPQGVFLEPINSFTLGIYPE